MTAEEPAVIDRRYSRIQKPFARKSGPLLNYAPKGETNVFEEENHYSDTVSHGSGLPTHLELTGDRPN